MIAYDTNILIYAFEGTNSWSKAAQLIVQQGEHDGAVLSILAWQELMTGAVMRGDDSDEQLATVLRNLSATRFVPVTLAICKRATALTKRYGKQLYGYDAIHIATAIEYKADFFVTNDKVLTNLQLDELVVRGL
ncbi:MAG TPA: PIN domain-containing protein [Candidatus Dormibacteraeota bacterium]|nr:PIN domain-containing protein [Candidatus Dormibacteraeota bacterium]